MKSNRTRTRRATTTVVTSLLAAAVIVAAGGPAYGETYGYVVSWFATATNNPDFEQNCPESAKDSERVKFVAKGRAVGGEVQLRTDRAVVNGRAVPPLAFPDAVQQDPSFNETVVGKYAYGFDLG